LKFEGTQKTNDNFFLNKNFPLSWRLLFLLKKNQLSPKIYIYFSFGKYGGKIFQQKIKIKIKNTPQLLNSFMGLFGPFDLLHGLLVRILSSFGCSRLKIK
jgi:hypothetical protein